MRREGPPLEYLLRRVVETPPEFLPDGGAHPAAVIHDVLDARFGAPHGRVLPRDRFQQLDAILAADRRGIGYGCALLIAWVLADPWFDRELSEDRAWMLVGTFASALAQEAPPEAWQSSAVRREELVRNTLAALDLRPAGETVEQATDRLTAISSSERKRVLTAAFEAEQRAAELRTQLANEAAQRAADKAGRE